MCHKHQELFPLRKGKCRTVLKHTNAYSTICQNGKYPCAYNTKAVRHVSTISLLYYYFFVFSKTNLFFIILIINLSCCISKYSLWANITFFFSSIKQFLQWNFCRFFQQNLYLCTCMRFETNARNTQFYSISFVFQLCIVIFLIFYMRVIRVHVMDQMKKKICSIQVHLMHALMLRY